MDSSLRLREILEQHPSLAGTEEVTKALKQLKKKEFRHAFQTLSKLERTGVWPATAEERAVFEDFYWEHCR